MLEGVLKVLDYSVSYIFVEFIGHISEKDLKEQQKKNNCFLRKKRT